MKLSMLKDYAVHRALNTNRLGIEEFTLGECHQLRRIAMTLHRWYEMECGIDGGCLERDETTQIPYWHRATHPGHFTPIADREKGAMKRLGTLMANHPKYTVYCQTDPRGLPLYIVRKSAIKKGERIEELYSARGIAVQI